MKIRSRSLWMLGSTLSLAVGCSGSSTITPPIGGGGTESVGGSANPAGGNSVTPAGGTSQVTVNPTGGAASLIGGSPTAGGAVSTSATGGSKATGTSATGGAKATTGGASPTTGGASPTTGGTKATTGGAASTGGSNGGGGAKTTGGAGPTGGTKAGGGASPTGGTKATTGGAGATGGASPAGGSSSVTVSQCNLPSAGASGQSAPSGSGSTVTVLNWAGFKSGSVSFTFDDANQSQIDNYQTLQAQNDKGNNVRYTFYLITGKSTATNAAWGTMHKDGHELGNHTKSHNSAASTTDIQAAEDFLKSQFGVVSYDVAAPNGDSSYVSVVPTMKEFLTNRTAGNGGGISPTDSPSSKQWQLPCIIPATGAAASAMESSISSTVSGGKWVTFLVHGFNTPASDQSEGAYQPVSITEFTSAVSWAKTQGLWTDTVKNVASYWIAQYNFSKLTPTTSGTDKTWTWKTSDFNSPYPSGKCLRVTTNGGTLKQGSTVLTWDDHGYYEVSLDAGTLTLSQ